MPQESFNCALGIDPALRVTYERILSHEKNTAQSMFAEQKKTTKHVVRTFITNNHTNPIKDLIVRDALPITSLDAVKITLQKPSALAEVNTGDAIDISERVKVRWTPKGDGATAERYGKYEWLVSVEGGKGCTLEAEWLVHMPSSGFWDEVAEKK